MRVSEKKLDLIKWSSSEWISFLNKCFIYSIEFQVCGFTICVLSGWINAEWPPTYKSIYCLHFFSLAPQSHQRGPTPDLKQIEQKLYYAEWPPNDVNSFGQRGGRDCNWGQKLARWIVLFHDHDYNFILQRDRSEYTSFKRITGIFGDNSYLLRAIFSHPKN